MTVAWTEKKPDVALHFFSSLVYMRLFYSFITIKHIELCNTIDFSVHLAETTCRRCSYLRLLSKILLKPQPLFLLQFLLKKKSPNVHFCVPAKSASNMNGWVPAPFYLLLSVRVRGQEGELGFQLPRVCWDRCLCAVESILSCLVLCLCWSFRGISSDCK